MKKIFYAFIFLFLMAVAPNVSAQSHITLFVRSDTIPHAYCGDTTTFAIATDQTCVICSLFKMKVYFGDGQTEIVHQSWGPSIAPPVYVTHNYKYPGKYSVRTDLIVDSSSMKPGYTPPVVEDSSIKSFDISSFCNYLPIHLFNDIDGSGIYKPGVDPFNMVPIKIQVCHNGLPVDTISLTSGIYYGATGAPGDIYAFKVIFAPHCFATTSPSSGILYDTLSIYSNKYPVKYIGLHYAAGSDFDLAVNAGIPVTGIHEQFGNIYVSNNGCLPTDAVVNFKFSTKCNFQYSWPPSSVSGNTITWNLTGLSPLTAPANLFYTLGPATTLAAGDTVHESAQVTPLSGDIVPSNNSEFILDTVRAGVDPNEMSVTPSGVIPSGTQLKYTINFENTGNDTAFNISVYDQLSDYVDPKSLELIMSSAEMNITTLNEGGHNVVKFDFPGINLLDSSHHGQCTGAVIFTVNTNPGLPNGTKIDNSAGIYFDYNPVVTTNTVENIIGVPASVLHVTNSAQIHIYPNPGKDILNVTSPTAITEIAINNIWGQSVMHNNFNTEKVQLDISALPIGIYFIKINGTDIRKFIKE